MIRRFELTAATWAAESHRWTLTDMTAEHSPAEDWWQLSALSPDAEARLDLGITVAEDERLVLVADVLGIDPGTGAGGIGAWNLDPPHDLEMPTLWTAHTFHHVVEAPGHVIWSWASEYTGLWFTVTQGAPLRFRRLGVYVVPQDTPLLDLVTIQAQAPGEGFQLSRDVLGTDRLGQDDQALVWRELIGQATEVSITRGTQSNGLADTVEAGVATIDLLVPADAPPGLDLRPGIPVRIASALTGTEIFTGQLEPIRETFRPGPKRPVTLSVIDAVVALSNTTLYGAAGPEAWNERVARLLSRVPSISAWRFADDEAAALTVPPLARQANEISAVAYLQRTVNSAGRGWHVAKDNAVVVGTTRTLGAWRPFRATWTDNYNSGWAHPDTLLSYIDVGVAFDAGAVVSNLTVTNHEATWEPETSEWQVSEAAIGPFTDPTAEATWGPRAATIDMAFYLTPHGDPSDEDYIPGWDIENLNRLARAYLTGATTPGRSITHLVADLTDRTELAAAIEIDEHVQATYQDIDQHSAVIGLKHTITPHRWTTTLYLRKA